MLVLIALIVFVSIQILNKDKEKANDTLKVAIKRIDKALAKGATTKNASARNKSRLTKKVNSME